MANSSRAWGSPTGRVSPPAIRFVMLSTVVKLAFPPLYLSSLPKRAIGFSYPSGKEGKLLGLVPARRDDLDRTAPGEVDRAARTPPDGLAHRWDGGADALQLHAVQGGVPQGLLFGLQAQAHHRGARVDAPQRGEERGASSGERRGRSTPTTACRSRATRTSAASVQSTKS